MENQACTGIVFTEAALTALFPEVEDTAPDYATIDPDSTVTGDVDAVVTAWATQEESEGLPATTDLGIGACRAWYDA